MQFLRSPLLVASAALMSLTAGCGVQTSARLASGSLSGNWSFAAQNQPVTLNLGFTQDADQALSAVARLSGTPCVSSSTDILLTGAVMNDGSLTLVSRPFAGTTLVLKGQVGTSGSAITGATWNFNGGACHSLGSGIVVATDYSPISGQYTGSFTDNSGNQLPVSATLQQTSQPNSDGQFTLSGSATFPSNTCFVQEPALTQSVVTGDALSMTYSDPQSSAVLTATGTFNSDATQLTISQWTIAGGNCDGDAGTGMLSSSVQ
jgi:hypothetical protein